MRLATKKAAVFGRSSSAEYSLIPVRIVSWNINSIRLRARAVTRFLKRYEPDVLCLQETKVEDPLFPRAPFERLGYVHHAIAGQKSYNGVAILSRVPLEGAEVRHSCGRRDCRHIFASLPGGIELHNVYVPAGGDLPDPERNPKFAHKLRFLESLTRWFRERNDRKRAAVLVGDLNVAPLPTDVWSHEKLKRVVTHTPVEVAAFEKLARAGGFVDALRCFCPPDEKLFTWWSYRAPDWKQADKGRRLDHALVTENLSPRLVSAGVVKRARGWKVPSDHVPVILELAETPREN